MPVGQFGLVTFIGLVVAAFIVLAVVCGVGGPRRCCRRGCRVQFRRPTSIDDKLMAILGAPFQEGIKVSQLITLQSVFFVPESCVDVYTPTPNTRTRSKALSVYVYLALGSVFPDVIHDVTFHLLSDDVPSCIVYRVRVFFVRTL